MSNLKEKFDKWNSKYISKKSRFEKIVGKWRGERQKEGEKLLKDLDLYSQDIQNSLNKDLNLSEKSELKSKIKKFKKMYKTLNETTKPAWRQWLEALVVAGVAVFFLKNFLFAFYHVPTGSAEVNILVGDRVLGNNMAYRFGNKPKRGDYVMYKDQTFKYDKKNKLNYLWQKYIGFSIPLLGLSSGPDNITKRIIALPGDKLEGRVEDGKPVIYLNDKKLDEPYLNTYPLIGFDQTKGFIALEKVGPFKIPDFLKKKQDVGFYSYDPQKDYADQPFYHMNADQIVLKPGTLLPWLKIPQTPTHDQYGRIVDNFGPFIVPEGKCWGMGDNRRGSYDSRFWGFLDLDRIFGRASCVLYSIDSIEDFWLFEFIKHPIDFWKRVRWNRFFKKVK